MAIVYRQQKGSRLSIEEMDGNFNYIENYLTGLTNSISDLNTGNFIPLTGTEEGNPITGDIHIDPDTAVVLIQKGSEEQNNFNKVLSFYPDEGINVYVGTGDGTEESPKYESDVFVSGGEIVLRSNFDGGTINNYSANFVKIGTEDTKFFKPIIFEQEGGLSGSVGINPATDMISLMRTDARHSVCTEGFLFDETPNDGNITYIFTNSSEGLASNIDFSEKDSDNKLIYAQRAYVDTKIAENLGSTNTVGKSYKSLVVLLTSTEVGTGMFDITTNILENNLGDITVTREFQGQFNISSSNPLFPIDRTVILTGNAGDDVYSRSQIAGCGILDDYTIRLVTTSNVDDDFNDAYLVNVPIEIRVYNEPGGATFDDTITFNNSYSTDEIKTGGKWINGKDIYRKVIKYTLADLTTTPIVSPTYKNSFNFLPLIPNLEEVVTFEHKCMNDGDIEEIGKELIGNIRVQMVSTLVHNFASVVYKGGEGLDMQNTLYDNFTLILEYTKTTPVE